MAIYPAYDDESLLSTSENLLGLLDGVMLAARRMRRIALARMIPVMRVFSMLEERRPRDLAIASVSHERLIVGPHHRGYHPIPIAI